MRKYKITLKKTVIFFLLIFQMLTAVYSQQVVSNSTKGYYISDSTVVNNIYIENENLNLKAIRIVIPEQINHKSTILYPSDVDEYGFTNGLKFISSTIIYNGEEKRVFLKEVQKVNDSISIYCYANDNKDVYYIKKKGSFGTIVSEKGTEIWKLFKNISNCSNIQEIDIQARKLNDVTINKLYLAYTDCNTNFFQKWQYGIITGVGIGIPKTIGVYNVYSLGVPSFVGLFMQVPLDFHLIFQPELLFSQIQNKQGYIGTNDKIIWNKDIFIRYSLQLPLLFRYNFNECNKKIIPYLELGPLIDKNLYSSYMKSDFQYGLALGSGIRYKLNSSHSFYIGLRFNHSSGKVFEYSKSILGSSGGHIFMDESNLSLNSFALFASYNL